MTRARDLAAFVSNADGDIKFDTDTLFIDSSANSVGIGTSTPTSYANGQTTLVVEDSSNPAIALSDTGQAKDWYLIAFGDGLAVRYAEGGGSGGVVSFTENMFFKNNGKVGINDSDPAYPLEVNGTIRAVGTNNLPALIVDGNSSNEGDICAATGQHISFGHHGLTGASGQFTERWRITSSGHFKAATNGLGIDFSASEGSGASSSILDDYEEGTWTPSVGTGSISGTGQGTYTKIGNSVTVRLYLQGVTNTTSSNNLEVTGLPFTAVGTSTMDSNAGSLMIRYVDVGVTEEIGTNSYVSGGATAMRFFAQTAGGNYVSITHASITSTGIGLRATVEYSVS